MTRSDSNAQANAEPQSIDSLRARMSGILDRELESRVLDANVNAAWQIMHGVICYGERLQIQSLEGAKVPAVEHMLSGGNVAGFELTVGDQQLKTTSNRGVIARLEPGSFVGQGHPDQWLAIFAMSNLPLDRKIKLGSRAFTLTDMARQAQADVLNNPLDEFSWTLIALTHYFPDEPDWESRGVKVSWEDLVEVELRHDINTSACGGSHRLAGLVAALEAKKKAGVPDSPVWDAAHEKVSQAIKKAFDFRSFDGGLSSFYFIGPRKTNDLAAEMHSVGHLFEFLALAVPREELQQGWIIEAGRRLCDIIDTADGEDVDCGALYHALNGLNVYLKRTSKSTSEDAR